MTLQCSGRGTCKHWDIQNVNNELAFCDCDRVRQLSRSTTDASLACSCMSMNVIAPHATTRNATHMICASDRSGRI
eukprot:179156-Amphidinium_carterae.1